MNSERTRKLFESLRSKLVALPIPKVLVVEDTDNDRIMLIKELGRFSCEVVVAYTAEDAIRTIQENGISVVLLDLSLPGLPGIEVLIQTKSKHPEMEFIITSGAGSSSDVNAALTRGAITVFEKPVTHEQLAQFLLESP